jgi:hypothetical protein
MNSSELSAWYKNRPIILWVEDPLTRTYLRALWSDADISFLVAGGNDAVVAAVRDARAGGDSNVYGFRDRDFLEPNVDDWDKPARQPHVFRPTRHEVENYLIRPDILSVLPRDLNPQERTALDIQARAKDFARSSVWWMAVRAVIHDARRELTNNFPAHPDWGTRSAIDASTAAGHLAQLLVSSEWSAGVDAWRSAMQQTWIADRLQAHHATYQAAIDNGSWPELWSGKDIFKELAGHVHVGKKKAVAADELAKAIGAWQNTNERTGELWRLHAALRWRAGRGPAPAPLAAAGGLLPNGVP